MIPVYQLNILKKARDKALNDDHELYLALSHAIDRLENHKCLVKNEAEPQEKTIDEDYHFNQFDGESQAEKYGY